MCQSEVDMNSVYGTGDISLVDILQIWYAKCGAIPMFNSFFNLNF